MMCPSVRWSLGNQLFFIIGFRSRGPSIPSPPLPQPPLPPPPPSPLYPPNRTHRCFYWNLLLLEHHSKQPEKFGFKIHGGECLERCPVGFTTSMENPHLCEKCRGVCQKICTQSHFVVRRSEDILKLRGCTKVSSSPYSLIFPKRINLFVECGSVFKTARYWF